MTGATKRNVGAAALLMVAAAGCARTPDPDLALACQVQRCVCRPVNPPVFRSVPDEEVQWRANGDAYCKPGYILRRVER